MLGFGDKGRVDKGGELNYVIVTFVLLLMYDPLVHFVFIFRIILFLRL